MRIPRVFARLEMPSLLTLGVVGLLPSVVSAQSFYWNVNSGLWPTVANWVDGDSNAVGALAANTGAGDYYLTNGTLGAQATTTMTGTPSPRFINKLTVGQYNTLFLTGTADTQNAGTPRVVTPLSNAGLIQAGTASTDFLRVELNSSGTNLNTGEIRASQGTFRLQLNSSGNLDNSTTGLIRVMSGATMNMSAGSSSGSIQNGTLRSEVGGLIQVGVYDVQSKLRIEGVTVDNKGTFSTIQSTTQSTTSARVVNTFLNGATAFTNAVNATVNVLNTGEGNNAGAVTRLDVRFDMNNTASFDNKGVLNVLNETTRTGGSLIGNMAVFSVNATGAAFINTGTVNVINNSTSAGATAEFKSVKSIVNAGIVRVKGDAGNANASFTVTGSGNNYTQSGTGQRTLLERGGLLSAEDVVIDSGDLGGVGTVAGLEATIGSAARLVAGDTLAAGAGAGALVFNTHLTFADNSEAVFALGADTAGSGRVTLGSGFDLTIGEAVTVSILDLDGSATAGTTYRLFELNGGSVTGSFTLNSLMPEGLGGYLTVGANYVDVTLTAAVPEPSTYGVLAAGLVGASVLGLRRRRG